MIFLVRKKYFKNFDKILVSLDSNHTHEHVPEELRLYAPLVSKGNHCIVFDTIVEDILEEIQPARPWRKSDNPKTAVWEFLKELHASPLIASDGQVLSLKIDKQIENQLLFTVAPDGFLRRE